MMDSVLGKSGNGLMVWMLESRSLVCAIQLPILELVKDFQFHQHVSRVLYLHNACMLQHLRSSPNLLLAKDQVQVRVRL